MEAFDQGVRGVIRGRSRNALDEVHVHSKNLYNINKSKSFLQAGNIRLLGESYLEEDLLFLRKPLSLPAKVHL